MVKKIIEDVVSLKKDGPNGFRSMEPREENKDPKIAAPEDLSVERGEFRKGMNHIEEILPETELKEQVVKEETIEKSPIFEKMKQRHEERESFSEEYTANRKGGMRRYLGKGVLALVIFASVGIAVWSTVFYSASITIHLKHVKASLNTEEFLADPSIPDTIPYQLMSLSKEETVKLTPTGEKRVTKKASGQIVIYNNFGKEAQTLVKNTRFETPDGKIYRIDRQISVPGITKVDGKDTPGALTVTVYADEAGGDYNIGLVDFTIPGFKGSPRYQKFYGRSKTAMTGGASGMVKTISDTDVETARTALMKSLKEKLLADAKAQKPQGTVLYPEAIFFTFTDTINDSVSSGEKDVPFTLKGDMEAVLWNEAALSRKIVQTAGDVANNEKIKIDNIESLAFAWKTPRSNVPEKTEKLAFLLSGSANAVWEVDINAYKNKIAGTKDSEYNGIVVEFSGIEKTSKKDIRPFWRHYYPKNTEKIAVEVVVD